MALLEDYSKLLQPTNIHSAAPGDLGGQGGLPAIPTSSYLPASSYATQRPAGAVNVTPTIVNFNPKNLPDAYQGQNVPQEWQNIIASDPDYMQWSLGAGQRASDAATQRRAAMQALAVRFGGLPSNFSDVYGDIDPTTLQTANANPESENNRLLRNYQQQVDQSRRQLAARGMLQSGELDYGQNQLDLARQGDLYDLNNQFLNAAQSNINDYGSIVAGLNSEQIDQIRAAADRIAMMRLMTPPPPPGPPGPDGTGGTKPPPLDPWAYTTLSNYATANQGTSSGADLYNAYMQNFYDPSQNPLNAGGRGGVGVGPTGVPDATSLTSLYPGYDQWKYP